MVSVWGRRDRDARRRRVGRGRRPGSRPCSSPAGDPHRVAVDDDRRARGRSTGRGVPASTSTWPRPRTAVTVGEHERGLLERDARQLGVRGVHQGVRAGLDLGDRRVRGGQGCSRRPRACSPSGTRAPRPAAPRARHRVAPSAAAWPAARSSVVGESLQVPVVRLDTVEVAARACGRPPRRRRRPHGAALPTPPRRWPTSRSTRTRRTTPCSLAAQAERLRHRLGVHHHAERRLPIRRERRQRIGAPRRHDAREEDVAHAGPDEQRRLRHGRDRDTHGAGRNLPLGDPRRPVPLRVRPKHDSALVRRSRCMAARFASRAGRSTTRVGVESRSIAPVSARPVTCRRNGLRGLRRLHRAAPCPRRSA